MRHRPGLPAAGARAAVLPEPPAALGFALPAEWAPHRATWIAWPHNASDWPGKFATLPWVYGEIVRHLGRHERVHILVEGATHEAAARRLLARVGVAGERVSFVRLPTDRVWMRDSGPLLLRRADGARAAVLWRFNAWAKYADWKRDARVGERVAAHLGLPIWRPQAGGRAVVLEGGAIDGDGQGTLLLTEECLLSDVQARNPGLGREGTEAVLAEALGARRVIWLGRGIAGDDTHGHVDDVARFVAPGRVVLADARTAAADDRPALEENRERLEGARDAAERRLEVIPLPMPSPLALDGRRLPASYANFYLANGLCLVPTFNDPADRQALGLLGELLPGREVVGIHAVDLVWGLGALHCLTREEPEGSP